MREAIALAAQSDFPFGAVIARGGTILSRGPNLGRQLNDPTAHAEMVAIRRFLAARPAEELKGATIYATAEPCPMCMGAILWCGLSRVVFGASLELRRNTAANRRSGSLPSTLRGGWPMRRRS